MLLRPSSPATSVDTVVMCGSLNPLPTTTHGVQCNTRAKLAVTQWFLTCPVLLSIPKLDTLLVLRQSLTTTSTISPRTLRKLSSNMVHTQPRHTVNARYDIALAEYI